MRCRIGYSHEDWKMGIITPFEWDTDKVPHLLIAGITGGGKTVMAQLIFKQLLEQRKDISVCDFKAGGDWDKIVPDYGEYEDCDRVLSAFYDSFTDTVRNKRKTEKYLLFDEFSSYAISKDTKGFKELMEKVSHMAFMGRSFGYHLLFISQQFSAKVLDTAVREQFGIKVYMGSAISTESASMLFPNCGINKSNHLPTFCGYVSMPEKELDIIELPYISEPYKLKLLLEKKGRELFCS